MGGTTGRKKRERGGKEGEREEGKRREREGRGEKGWPTLRLTTINPLNVGNGSNM